MATLLEKYRSRDQKGFLIESLWKFLLYSEIALAAYREIEARPAGMAADEAEATLMRYLDDAEFMAADFSVRLERVVEALLTSGPEASKKHAQPFRSVSMRAPSATFDDILCPR